MQSGRGLTVAGTLLIYSLCCASARAQADLINVFGGMVRAGMAQASQVEWEKLPATEIGCINQGLRQRGSSVNRMIEQTIMPNDRRIADVMAACSKNSERRAPQQSAVQTKSYPQYLVDGFALGGQVQSSSAAYRDYQCSPSDQFVELTLCRRSRNETEKRGPYNSITSILHDTSGAALYVNRFLEPAFFAGQEGKEDVDRLSKKFGQPRIVGMPTQSAIPNGMIAIWGDIKLEPLPSDLIADLANGRNVRAGLLIDHIGNFRKSARLGLPVYRLGGGAGYVWSASWEENGRGTLRFLTADPSRMKHADPALQSTQSTPPPAAPQTNPAELSEGAKAADARLAEERKADDEKATAERSVAKAAADKAVEERLAAAKEATEKAAAEKAAAERAAAERVAAEKAAGERLAAEKEWKQLAETREKGASYARSSGTTWTISHKQNEMTDKEEVRIVSIQKSQEGAVAEVTGYCIQGEVQFSALLVDEDGKATLSLPGRMSFGNELGSGVSTLYRLNDAQPNNANVLQLEYSNKFLIAVLLSPTEKVNEFEGTIRMFRLFGGANIYLSSKTTWRVMTEFKTSRGSMIVRVPIFDQNVQSLIRSCQ